jgi:AcrR family transcriptional regulator
MAKAGPKPSISDDPGDGPGKPSFRERQKQLRESEIIATAAALLSSKGYAGMTLDDVANEVGISKPTLYQHFSSKEELGARILLDALRTAQTQFARLAKELPPREAVKTMMEWGIESHFGNGIYVDLKSTLFLFANAGVRKAERDLTASMAEVVQRGQDDGTIPSVVPARMIAQTFSSILKNTAYEDDHRDGVLNLEQLKAWTVRLLIGYPLPDPTFKRPRKPTSKERRP